jgi:centromere protein I
LEEIEDASSLAASIDKLELPNQLVAVLADPVLQKLLLLRPSDDAYQRVVNWLQAVLQDAITGNTPEDTLWDILEVVHEFVKQTQVRGLSLAYQATRH